MITIAISVLAYMLVCTYIVIRMEYNTPEAAEKATWKHILWTFLSGFVLGWLFLPIFAVSDTFGWLGRQLSRDADRAKLVAATLGGQRKAVKNRILEKEKAQQAQRIKELEAELGYE